IAVNQSGASVRQIAVPHLVGAFGQIEPGDFAAAAGIEQAELDALGIGGEHGKVGAKTVPGSTERIRAAGVEPVGVRSHRSTVVAKINGAKRREHELDRVRLAVRSK